MLRRVSTVAAGAVAAIALTAGSASAHFCFFNEPNELADANRHHTKAFVTFTEYMSFTQLCDEGIEFVAGELGVTTDTMMNVRGVMGGPTDGNKSIGHLDFEDFMAAAPQAYELCGMEMPVFEE